MFANNTPVFDIEQRVTERVRSELIGRGKYKVEPHATGDDAVLTGEITSITLAPAAFTEEQQASRYVLTVTARIEFKDLKTDKVLWSNPAMQFREEFEPTTPPARPTPTRSSARTSTRSTGSRPSSPARWSAPCSKRSSGRGDAADGPQADRTAQARPRLPDRRRRRGRDVAPGGGAVGARRGRAARLQSRALLRRGESGHAGPRSSSRRARCR